MTRSVHTHWLWFRDTLRAAAWSRLGVLSLIDTSAASPETGWTLTDASRTRVPFIWVACLVRTFTERGSNHS